MREGWKSAKKKVIWKGGRRNDEGSRRRMDWESIERKKRRGKRQQPWPNLIVKQYFHPTLQYTLILLQWSLKGTRRREWWWSLKYASCFCYCCCCNVCLHTIASILAMGQCLPFSFFYSGLGLVQSSFWFSVTKFVWLNKRETLVCLSACSWISHSLNMNGCKTKGWWIYACLLTKRISSLPLKHVGENR